VRRTLIVAVTLALWAHPGVAFADTATGQVDAARMVATRRVALVFQTSAPTTISATLHWRDAAADLNLFLARQQADGTWRRVAAADSTTAHPERLQEARAGPGTYRFMVRAISGSSTYRLVFDAGSTTPPPPPPTTGPFMTLLFSRSEVTAAPGCAPEAGALNLLTQVAPALQQRGLRPTGSVETGVMRDTQRSCIHYRHTLAASWADLATLRDRYGWTFVSHGRAYVKDLPSLTPSQQWADTCGSIVDLEQHGHWRGDGLFAYPDNKWSTSVQTNVVDTCFAFGRRYGMGPTHESDALQPPYWQRTWGIAGGRCSDPDRACSRLDTVAKYRSPVRLAAAIRKLGPNDWLTLQSYVFVTGSSAGNWDCTAPNWQDHWTADVERYCWNDYQEILDAIPTGMTVTDPKTVAEAWGRRNYRVPAP
jgi:hypothetical protein